MSYITIPLALHLLAAVIWVGGMFAAFVCLRPAVGALEPPQRLILWRGFFAKFLLWVWASVVVLLVTGYWMLSTSFGGFAAAPTFINLMQMFGWLMILLFFYMFHGPWLAFKRAVDAQDWATADINLNRIRNTIKINLPLGLIAAIIGGTGRYWG